MFAGFEFNLLNAAHYLSEINCVLRYAVKCPNTCKVGTYI